MKAFRQRKAVSQLAKGRRHAVKGFTVRQGLWVLGIAAAAFLAILLLWMLGVLHLEAD